MTTPVVTTLRILGQYWLEEIRLDDAEIITVLPELAQSLPNFDTATLTELAVEYQRLFGFYLPPYESVFVDPSAMLMTPATQRVQMLYYCVQTVVNYIMTPRLEIYLKRRYNVYLEN